MGDRLRGGTTIGGFLALHKGNLESVDITEALGFTPLSTTGKASDSNLLDGHDSSYFYPSSNPDDFISALGFTPYNSTNPSGFTSNTGTVTSVGGTGTVNGLTLSGTVTTTGNITLGGTLTVSGSDFSSQTANTFFAAPNGSNGNPIFRAIVAADIPTLNQNTTGSAGSVTNSLTIGNGLTLSSGSTYNGSAAVTASLGTPTTLTSSTSNSVTASSHTHSITSGSISGTTNQITVTGTGKVLDSDLTLSLPQSIATTSNVRFNSVSSGTSTEKCTMQYNSTTKSMEFIFSE